MALLLHKREMLNKSQIPDEESLRMYITFISETSTAKTAMKFF